MPSGGEAVASACMQITRVLRRLRAMFVRQTSRALALKSTATSFVAGSSCPTAQVMQPLPQQRSSTRASIFQPVRACLARSTSSSVSGRGMSTSFVTFIGRP